MATKRSFKMKLSAKQLNEEEFIMTSGIVGIRKDGKIPVRTAKGLVLTVRAAGCLLEPEEGNTVLIAENSFGGGYILTVLERNNEKPAMLGMSGDITFKAGGNITISGENIAIAGEESMDITAPSFSLRSQEGSVETENMNLTGKHFSADLKSVKTILGSLESSVGRLVQRITRYYSRIDELADMRFKKLHCFVRDTLSMKGRDITVRAEKNINMDGKKINVG
jgi:hypothetical protein